MPFIVVNEKKLSLDSVTFDAAAGVFKLHSSADQSRILTFEYVLTPHTDYQPKDYSLYILYKSKFSENDIFQVYEREQNNRIGWIFPLQSLLSTDHDYAENVYFLKYAFVAFQKLLTNANNSLEFALDRGDINELGEVYDVGSTIVLILSNENLPKGFHLPFYLPALFKYGYYFKYVKGFDSKTKPLTGKKVHLQQIASPLQPEDYLIELFEELIYEQHPLVKFHLLYQVIELLIEKILRHEFKAVCDELKAVCDKLEEKKIYIHDLQEHIKDFIPEEKRITKLFSDYEKNLDTGELQNQCDLLLQALGKAEQTDKGVAKSLYAVRNFVVHDYRSLPKSQIDTLNEINSYFEILLIDMLLNLEMPPI